MRVQPASDPSPALSDVALADVEARSTRGAVTQALAVLATASPVIFVALWSVLFAF